MAPEYVFITSYRWWGDETILGAYRTLESAQQALDERISRLDHAGDIGEWVPSFGACYRSDGEGEVYSVYVREFQP